MSNAKIVIDAKSFLIGLLFCFVFFISFGFNSSTHDTQTGKFQVEIDSDAIIILNSETGEYIFRYLGLGSEFRKFKFEDASEPIERKKRK